MKKNKFTNNGESKKIIIRCMTDPYYGLGHFKRCLILANELKKKNYRIHFLVTSNRFAENRLAKLKFHFNRIPNFSSIERESKYIFSFMLNNNYKIALIDMRELSEHLCRDLYNKKIKTILLDDAWTKKAYADLIFNGTIIKRYHKYEKKNKSSKIFVGPKYFLVENEFKKFRKKITSINQKPYFKIVITSGGTDPNGISLLALKSIMDLPKIEIEVVVGPFSKNLVQIKRLIKNRKNITILVSPNNIWKIFNSSDVVISSSGNTLCELSLQRVPTISIAAEDHQIPYGKTFSKNGFGLFLGLWKNVTAEKIQITLSKLLSNNAMRKKISIPKRKLVDENSPKNIVLEINTFIKNFDNYSLEW